ncbi:unnamed protein product [Candidula unifasciata]|uniref:Bardet-Biedl syndrome 10 protein n=1 Tax=Candidula unifasciata TaxID=100452 RepID=A0A8S3ZTV8_9EUPU|nr:unnamed protein product [Candidula unifasciata]
MDEKQIIPIHLKDLRIITGSLKNTISKSFGPNCQQALLTSSTGQMSVTCSGVSILSSLHICHPIAKVIVDSMTSFYQVYGDGSKTLIVYVDELLSAIELHHNKRNHGSSADTSFRVAVSRSLYEFVNSELVYICDNVSKFVYAQNSQKDVQACQIFARPLYNVILPCLQGLPGQVCDHLADILTSFVMSTVETGMDLNIVQKFLDNFLFVLPNRSYMNSYFREGLFLQGSVFGQQFSASTAKVIFLQCPLEGNVDKQASDTVTFNCDSSESLLTYRTHVTRRTLQELKNAGVSLILTTQKVPPFVLQMCHSLDLSVVACLSDANTDLMMFLTGKVPVTSVYDGVHSENIITVASWEHTVVAGKHFVSLMFDDSCAKYKPYAMFICVPSESFHQQIKTYVRKSLTVTNNCLLASIKALNKTSFSSTCSLSSAVNTENVCSIPDLEKPDITGRNPHEIKFIKSKSSSIINNILAGNGYFEHVLIYFLKQSMESDISPQKQTCCNLIIKILEAVPKMLHKKQLVSKSGHNGGFLHLQKDIMKAIDVAAVSGVSTKNLLDYFHNGAVDVLNIKFEIVFVAVNLVVKLLRVDYLVGVKKLIHPKSESAAQDDDDDIE